MSKVWWLCLLVLLVTATGCRAAAPEVELTNEQRSRLELVPEIKAFQNRLGFEPTENFKTYSLDLESYHYWFYTPQTELPYSLDDPRLQWLTGEPENVSLDLDQYDVFSYSIEALAGIETPLTRALLEAPLARFILIIFHEDWHEQIDLPLGIEEPTGEVVSYIAALRFTAEKFGPDSAVHRTLYKELSDKLEAGHVYRSYYEQLDALYAESGSGAVSGEDALREKERLFQSMGDDLEAIWGGRPDQLNNAYLAFQMTYFRHLPRLYEVFWQTEQDLAETMSLFRSMPGQGAEYHSLEEVVRIEDRALDSLRRFAPSVP